MAKLAKSAKLKNADASELAAFDPYAHLDKSIDSMEKQFELSAMSFDKNEPRFSTGLLSLNIMLANGLLGGGWYTCFGGEQSCKCLVGDSLVVTDSGLLRLDEIYLESSKSTLEGFNDITPITVESHKGKRQATKVYIGKGSTYRIKTKLGDVVEGLPDHKLWSLVDGKFTWTRLDKLKQGAYVPKKIGTNIYAKESAKFNFKPDLDYMFKMTDSLRGLGDVHYPSEISENLAEIFGWLVSEGSPDNRFHNKNPYALNRFNKLVKRVFGQPCKTLTDNYAIAHGLVLRFFSEYLGNVTSAERFTPVSVRCSPKNIQTAYLRSLFEGDGAAINSKNGTVTLTTLSRKLAEETKYMLENMGMLCYIRERTTWATNGSESQIEKEAYVLSVHPDFAHVFESEVGFLSNRKNEILRTLIERSLNSKSVNSRVGPTNTLPGAELAVHLINIVNRISPNLGISCSSSGQSSVFSNISTKDLRSGKSGLTRCTLSRILNCIVEYKLEDSLPDEGKELIKTLKHYTNYYWTTVDYSKRTRLKKLVYDLNVEDTHSYHVNGMISHNSTLAMTILSSIMLQKDFRGKAAYFDYEGSSQAEYIENIMRSMGIKDNIESVFGVQDEETGDWIVKPRVRYYTPDTGEKFFHYLAKLEKLLPDKVKKGGQWYFVYENNRDNQKALKGRYDKALFSKYNQFYIPAPDGTIQAIILTDSYPAMLPDSADKKEEGDKGLALQARMFADGLKRVKSAMRRKRIVVLGVNQLRKVPMAMYGPSETEPCGDALKYFSDVRFRNSSVSIPHGKGMLEEEDSVIGDGVDTYRYIKIRTHKNKLGGVPNQEVTLRIVVENANGTATGFCRVWDAYTYLKLTGQIGGQRNKIKFLEGFNVVKKDPKTQISKEVYVDFKNPFAGTVVNWLDFKTLIEGHKDDIKALCKKLKMSKPVMLRSFLENQCSDGLGFTYMKDAKRAKSAEKRSADKSDADDEE